MRDFFLHLFSAMGRLKIKDSPSAYSLCLEDGTEILEDCEVTDPDIVQGKLLILRAHKEDNIDSASADSGKADSDTTEPSSDDLGLSGLTQVPLQSQVQVQDLSQFDLSLALEEVASEDELLQLVTVDPAALQLEHLDQTSLSQKHHLRELEPGLCMYDH